PEDVLYAQPQLCLMYAWGLLFGGEIEAYKRPLIVAEQIWKREENDAKLGEVLNLRADIALSRNQLETGVKLARQALELLDKDDAYNRNLSWMYLGSAYYPMGEIKQARQALEKSRAMSQMSGNRYAYTAASNTLGMVLVAQGQLEQAADLYRQVMQLSGDAVLHGGLVAQILYGHILLEWHDLDAAEQQLRPALELLEKTGLEIYAGVGYTFMALLLHARGKMEQVHDFIDRAIQIECQLGDPFRERQARAIKARLALMQGDETAVIHWLQT
ncbi:MAG: tetratricopeptide repeat protein, partial [bacterium]|nr:tetratricopeptide repeat protein [bacterium]